MLLMNTTYLNEGNATTKMQETKKMNKDGVSAYAPMSCDTSSPCTQLYVFWIIPCPLIKSFFLQDKKVNRKV